MSTKTSPYTLTEEEFESIRSLTHRFSTLTLLAAGQKEDQIGISTGEFHALFEEPWLKLRDIVTRVEADTVLAFRAARPTA
jgi:hypothetical protein